MAQKQDEADGEDYEEIEDESLVLVELSGIIDTDFIQTCSRRCKFVGIDSEQPVLQIDRYIFTGEYEDTVGTCVVFEEDETGSETEDSSPDRSSLRYMCHTAKKLSMTRSFLAGRNDDTDSMAFLHEDNPYQTRAVKLASSCYKQILSKDKSASEDTTSDHQEDAGSAKPRKDSDDVEMTKDVVDIQEESSKDVDMHAEDNVERIHEMPKSNIVDTT